LLFHLRKGRWGSKNEVTKNPWRGMSDILRMASGTSDNPLYSPCSDIHIGHDTRHNVE
jgi:hypothetical protein